MQKWLHDRPWIWIVLLLGFLVISGFVVLVIAERNRPEIVKVKAGKQTASLLVVPDGT